VYVVVELLDMDEPRVAWASARKAPFWQGGVAKHVPVSDGTKALVFMTDNDRRESGLFFSAR